MKGNIMKLVILVGSGVIFNIIYWMLSAWIRDASINEAFIQGSIVSSGCVIIGVSMAYIFDYLENKNIKKDI